jgi:hypothetical protein
MEDLWWISCCSIMLLVSGFLMTKMAQKKVGLNARPLSKSSSIPSDKQSSQSLAKAMSTVESVLKSQGYRVISAHDTVSASKQIRTTIESSDRYAEVRFEQVLLTIDVRLTEKDSGTYVYWIFNRSANLFNGPKELKVEMDQTSKALVTALT